MSLPRIGEDTTAMVTIAFTDTAGSPVAPSAVSYRIDCLTNGREILDWTSFGGTLAATIAIMLPATLGGILDPANASERRALQYVATYGASDSLHGEVLYDLVNRREPMAPVIIRGDDYADADGRAFKWTGGGGWPPLDGAGATVLFRCRRVGESSVTSLAASIEQATGLSKTVRLEFSAAQTLALAAGPYEYQLAAQLATGGRWVTLARGGMTVMDAIL